MNFLASKFKTLSFFLGTLIMGIIVSPAVNAQTTTNVQESTVNLSAFATREVAKDMISISLVVTKEGTDSATVQGQVKQVLDAALQQVRPSVSAGALDVQTGSFSVQPRYSNAGKINGWQGNAQLIIKGKDMTKVAQVAGALQQMNIVSVDYSLSREIKEKYEQELTQEAIANFRRNATQIAGGFGFESYAIKDVNVNTNSTPDGGPEFRSGMMMSKALASDMAVPVEAGKGFLTVTVSGRIVLK